jgi:hypothetical protein
MPTVVVLSTLFLGVKYGRAHIADISLTVMLTLVNPKP